MSKFINTNQKVVIDSLVDGFKDRLKNPYYLYTDKKASPVDYYNQNTTMSTLDEAAKTAYALVGNESPIKYNLIKDAFLYGISKVEINQQIGEYGLESDSIEGEAIVLPNTFIPVANDYFRINYLNDDNILFKVIEVTIDTLDTGANIYKLRYKLDRYADTRIDDQVVEKFKMITGNVGTNYKAIIRSDDYDIIETLDNISSTIKKYYLNLFYKNKIQTFVFNYNDDIFYDPYMIEFIIRNKLLEGSGEFIYVAHDVALPATFAIDYDNSFFRCVELCDKNKLNVPLASTANIITDINSLMSVRSEEYYMIDYNHDNANIFKSLIQNFPADLLNHIASYELYNLSINENYAIWNILIEYFNNEEYNTNILNNIDNIKYNTSIDIFYGIPILIFIIEKYIKSLLK